LKGVQKNSEGLAEALNEAQQKRASQTVTLENLLSKYEESIPNEVEKHEWYANLQKRTHDYKHFAQQAIQLDQELIKLQAQKEKLEDLIKNDNEQLNKWERDKNKVERDGKNLSNRRKALFGTQNPKEEQERLNTLLSQMHENVIIYERKFQEANQQLALKLQSLDEKRKLLKFEKQDYQNEEKQLNEEIKREKLEGIEQVKTAILKTEVFTRIKQDKDRLDKEWTELQGAIRQTARQLAEYESKSLTKLTKEEVAKALHQEKQNYDKTIGEIKVIEHRLQENEALQLQMSDLQQNIEIQRKELDRWQTLSNLVGTENTNRFRIFAQSLTLEKLVQLANRHLHKLNPRYMLRRKISPNSDLELEIVDIDQADNVRSMQTLSGGETFLVSLALALGLSDLAGRHTRIESLFIDEGFGTLDSNTLDSAVTTLENLQASGKMIGVISHVEALKERIVTQIRVEKMGNGISKIDIN
jgi:exonuclease SbcC